MGERTRVRSHPARTLTRRLALSAAVTGLLLGAVGPVSAAGPPVSAATDGADGSPLATARAEAARTGQPVTVDQLTTETSETVANADGTFTLTTHLQPARVRKEGEWTDIDAGLARNSDGTFSTKATPSALTLSGGGDGPLATLVDEAGHRLSYTLPFRLPAPDVSGDSAEYSDVLPGVDLKVTTTDQGGFHEVLIVHDAKAAADPALASLRLTTAASDGMTVNADHDGQVTATAADGTALFSSPTPMMWDSSGAQVTTPAQRTARRTARAADAPAKQGATGDTASTAEQPGSGAQVKPIGVSSEPGAITLTPDADLLGGNGTVWPLYIDPYTSPITSKKSHFITVKEGCPSQSPYDDAQDNGEGVGYEHWRNCFGLNRAYYELNIGNLTKSMVISKSVVHLTSTYGASFDCDNETGVRLATVSGISKDTDWDHQPKLAGDGYIGGTQKVKSSNLSQHCGDHDVNFDVTGQIKKLAGKDDSWTFGLWGNESKSSTNYDFVRFATNPYLTTVFDIAPAEPDRLGTTPATINPASNGCDGAADGWIGESGLAGDTSDITLNAHLNTDMSGVNLRARYEVWDTKTADDDGGSTSKSKPVSGWVSDGGTTRVNIGFKVADGHQYGWHVRADDDTLMSGWSPNCYFKIDLSAPGIPSFTDSPVLPPLGAEQSPTGHAGDEGVKVKVTANDPTPTGCTRGSCVSSGIDRFEYSLDTNVPGSGAAKVDAVATSGGSATAEVPIVLSAAQWGAHTLYVRAVDNAGNTQGTVGQYSFFAPWNPKTKVTAGDLDGDAVPDLAAPTTDGDLVLVRGNVDPAAPPVPMSTKAQSPDGTGWDNYLVAHRGTATGSNVDDLFAFNTSTHELYLYPNDAVTPGHAAGHFTLTQNVVPIRNSDSCPARGSDGTWNNVTQILAPGKLAQYADVPDLITVDKGELWYYPGTFQAGCNLGQGVKIGTGDWSDTTLLAPGTVGGVPTLWARDNATGAISSFPLTFAAGVPTAKPAAPRHAPLVSGVLDTVNKNLCLDIAGSRTANGTAAQMYTCNDSDAQNFTLGTDHTVHALGKCLDVTKGDTDNGTPVQLYQCNNTGSQEWVPGPYQGTLKNPQSGRCLADPASNRNPRTRVVIWDCKNIADQKWAATEGNVLPAAQPILPVGVGEQDYPTTASPGDVQGTGFPALYATSRSGRMVEYPGAAADGGLAQFTASVSVGHVHRPADWWKLDGTADSVRPANSLTLSGGAIVTADPARGSALALNGSTGYAATSGPVLDTSRSHTVSAWANLSSLTANSTFVSQSGASANGLQLYYSAGAHAFAFGRAHEDGESTFTAAYGPTTGAQSPRTNKWFHLVGVFDADTQQLRLYVNGDLADTAAYDGTLWNATGPLQIGRRLSKGAYGEYTDGKVADVQLFTEALTPGGVASLDRNRPVPTQLS
ncbi:ricin-type beta-trefoil lectin domain protein [Streptomyces mirabilis]|uniref:LamG-like jellyroll fold domain-containing protein n=1 Tax=Streptomyces mirabilis TaxID=68239 RepID=UPI0021C10816|nr:LamG-like jellyroll fold domain-containing protein [Streptomyces mirabilis]MCT9109858.1 ricin-type beta-trefoil lectin domain protein [Streptomyces mirabilis]